MTSRTPWKRSLAEAPSRISERECSMFRLLLAVAGAWLLSATPYALAEDAKFVRLRQAETGKVLAVADDSEEAGTRIVVAKEDAKNESQQWKLEKDGDHYK